MFGIFIYFPSSYCFVSGDAYHSVQPLLLILTQTSDKSNPPYNDLTHPVQPVLLFGKTPAQQLP